jgi:hypothetical protein
MKTVLKKNVTQLLSIITFTATVIFLVACTGNGSSTPSLDEESGTDLNLDQVYDQIHDGARLFLSYQPDDNSFIGFIENTTDGALERVQVIVLLSNGVQLGPTEPADLAPNERRDVKLSAKNIVFSGWIAESKVGESLGG